MLGLFSALLNIQDDVQDGSNNRVGNHMGCAMIYCTKKKYFFVFVPVIISFNPCTIYEEINAREFRMVDITKNFVTECLLKVQTLLNHMRKNVQLESGMWMDG